MAVGEYYHVFNRGVDKRTIFLNKRDYDQFHALLFASNIPEPIKSDNARKRHKRGPTSLWITNTADIKNPFVHIGAYCLMPNHFHLLVYEYQEGGLSCFLQKLLTAYTMYFNTKNERNGVLFQGKTKKKWVDSDTYLRYLFAYIHLNPLDIFESGWKEIGLQDLNGAQNFLTEYKYSSYLDYLGYERMENRLLQKESFPNYFPDSNTFENHVYDFLTYPQARSDLA